MLAVNHAEIGVQRRSTTATRCQRAASGHVMAEEVRHGAAFNISGDEVALDATDRVAKVGLDLAPMRDERFTRFRALGETSEDGS